MTHKRYIVTYKDSLLGYFSALAIEFFSIFNLGYYGFSDAKNYPLKMNCYKGTFLLKSKFVTINKFLNEMLNFFHRIFLLVYSLIPQILVRGPEKIKEFSKRLLDPKMK